MRRQYVPNNMVVAVAGNVDEDEVAGAAGADAWARCPPAGPTRWFPAKDGQTEPRCSACCTSARSRRTSPSACTRLPLNHPDRYALDLLSVLFGESMSSRLFMELRERQGLCYDVHSYVTHFLDAGSFGVYAAVDPTNARRRRSRR